MMNGKILVFSAAWILACVCSACSHGEEAEELTREESLRRQLIASQETSRTVFDDASADPIRRRTAFRTLLKGENAEAVLEKAVTDGDPVIRTRAVYELFHRKGRESVPFLKRVCSDPDPQVASLVIACAREQSDPACSAELLKLLAEKSPIPEVRREALRLVDFPYYRETKLLRNDPTHDHEVVSVGRVPLPIEGWKFKADPMSRGHHQGWFEAGFDDGKWKLLKIGSWESQGFDGYDGIAWYRIRFTMPPRGEARAAEICFQAVDEAAWVWVNGKYVGQHDIGPDGWNRPFELDITNEVNWGGENVLAVRVEDTVSAGGIWKPVIIELVK